MAVAARKIRRTRVPGELTIEQARDPAVAEAMLEAAGLGGCAASGACWLVAYFGDQPAAVAGVESYVDAALLCALFVSPGMRRRGIGSAILAAARTAAHTRGARSLYALPADDSAAQWLIRFGFASVSYADLTEALGKTAALVDREHGSAVPTPRPLLCLDLSNDGVIIR